MGILLHWIHLIPEFQVTEPLTKRARILFEALDRLSEPGVSVSESYNIPDAAFGHGPALKISVECTVRCTPEGHVCSHVGAVQLSPVLALAIVGASAPHM